ncbi:MAG: ribosomal-processing cysteine protease Prp [Oscillospiraceae bacterium]|nr:ribosomal-processing cysteine protease Prp [Oscillospiraceae bacterium]
MIRILFFQQNNRLCGCRLSGHAGYADRGEDIVCASVSSAVQLTANMLTEIFHTDADVCADANSVSIKLPDNCSDEGVKILEGLKLHAELLKEDYPKFIQITHTEV